jgi:dTDP-4-dehydrorhamnose reductase
MKILVTGANGQLGSEMRVASANYPQHEFDFTDYQELNICDADAVERYFAENSFDFIVNCAAYTAVDNAETDEANARKLNRDAVGVLAEAAQRHNVKMIHVSTDYVFDGNGHQPYNENDAISPNTVYGKTKAEGEQVLQKILPDSSVIIRTAWLYSSFGKNFVKTMMKLCSERDRLTVVFDQIGSPTYAADLAEAIMKVVSSEKFVPGVYHFSNEGVCSWYDFTRAICMVSGIAECDVQPIESKDYPAKTPRPFYSVLNKRKIKETYGVKVPYWYDSLVRCVKLLKA